MAPTWYLGPAGQLQALTCPETGVERNPVRYGGVHRGFSGAATVDVTGYKYEYELQWTWAEESEIRALEVMHERIVRGPFWLLDPTKRNRLSVQATQLQWLTRTFPGVRPTSGTVETVKDWPSAAGLGNRAIRWTNQAANNHQLVFDHGKWTPVLPGETLTGSVYIKGSGSVTVRMVWMDSDGVDWTTPSSSTSTVTGSWVRYKVTGTVPAGASLVRFELARGSSSVEDIDVAAPQLEVGSTPSEWQPGGGATLVHIDQFETRSPRYPLFDVNLTLLEA